MVCSCVANVVMLDLLEYVKEILGYELPLLKLLMPDDKIHLVVNTFLTHIITIYNSHTK